MSLFDFTFGLNAVILGLALAEMATRFQQLVFAGRRVRWAVEPMLLSAAIFLVIVVVWLGFWQQHEIHETTIGLVTLQLLTVIGPYMAASAVLPRPPEEGVMDLHAHYDATRRFVIGTLLVAQLLYWAVGLIQYADRSRSGMDWATLIVRSAPYYDVVPYAALMFIRNRWFNIVTLLLVLSLFAYGVLPRHLTG